MTSDDLRAALQAAMKLIQQRDFVAAEQACTAILSLVADEPNAIALLGNIQRERGNIEKATVLFERAVKLLPHHIHALVNLGSCYRQLGRLDDAQQTLNLAINVDSAFAPAFSNLGMVLWELGKRNQAQAQYQRAIELNPRYADALAGLAQIAEAEHRLDDALALAGRALENSSQHFLARLMCARALMRLDRSDEAIAAFQDLKAGTLSPINGAIVEGYLGELFDHRQAFDEAFAAFDRANSLMLQIYDAQYSASQGVHSPHFVACMMDYVRSTAWPDAAKGVVTQKSPVFLIGFPRSGTTLLDQILSSHSSVTTLEERDCLAFAARDLLLPAAEPALWNALDESRLEAMRSGYWREVERWYGGRISTPVFIDKLPLNANLLPVIDLLFPGAKVILAVRDPRDVCLSCFQQRFGMNVGMFQTLRLERLVAYYSAVLGLVEASERKLSLDFHRVKYESVISDFDRTIGDVLHFLGLTWSDEVRNYVQTAQARTIATPSATQVIKPLYPTSVGKWRNYEKYLSPHLPILQRWIDALGYGSGSGALDR